MLNLQVHYQQLETLRMAQNPTTMVGLIKHEIKKRKPIDQEIKAKLIMSVVQDHLPIYQGAILHKVKYSSAKHILRNYFSDTANYFSLQRRRKRKIYCTNLFVIVDVNSGKIALKKYQPQSVSCNQNGSGSMIHNRIMNQLSNTIISEMASLKRVQNKKKNENINVHLQIQNLYEVLKQQHQSMINLKQ